MDFGEYNNPAKMQVVPRWMRWCKFLGYACVVLVLSGIAIWGLYTYYGLDGEDEKESEARKPTAYMSDDDVRYAAERGVEASDEANTNQTAPDPPDLEMLPNGMAIRYDSKGRKILVTNPQDYPAFKQ